MNNSVTHLSNYITVDKGKLDGIMPDMGVVSERGVVGIVSTVSDHFSVIIPLLNPKFRLSCKVLGSSYFGSLSWNGRNTLYANLDELPRPCGVPERRYDRDERLLRRIPRVLS